MLFKLSLSNIRKSLRDYAIYFFTLIIGVSLFYVFNAIYGQAAMMKMSSSTKPLVELLDTAISATSVCVAGVLGLLIVYASRFLMKRRSQEFALYMLLGMGKAKISAILLSETVIIGIGSLFVGLAAGIGLSQLMSALVAKLFRADMSSYRFTVSSEAVVKTVICFAVMYLVVMIFNSAVVTRMKLIDLIQSGRKSEQIKLKSPALCIALFVIAVLMLGYAYYQVGFNSGKVDQTNVCIYIALGTAATILIFWSVSGMMLRVLMSMKDLYHRGLNAFTFRQISSRVNTMVLSMSVICLMLFVTICTLTSAFSIRNSMNKEIDVLCPADHEIMVQYETDEDMMYDDIASMLAAHGYDITADMSGYVTVHTYSDPSLSISDSLGSHIGWAREQYAFLDNEYSEDIVKLSEYNSLMDLYGRDRLTLGDDEFIMVCNMGFMTDVRNKALADTDTVNVFGHALRPALRECADGFIGLSAERVNLGIYVVPDNVIDEKRPCFEYLIGNYASDDKESANEAVCSCIDTVARAVKDSGEDKYIPFIMNNTRADIIAQSAGIGAIITFIGLYIGLVFLIASGAVLALKALSESSDSAGRYAMLRKIGTEEKAISGSLFGQTGIFFLLPILLAVIHSYFGMRFCVYILREVGVMEIGRSIALTSLILLFIYGGYFLVTYFCSRSIIKEHR